MTTEDICKECQSGPVPGDRVGCSGPCMVVVTLNDITLKCAKVTAAALDTVKELVESVNELAARVEAIEAEHRPREDEHTPSGAGD